MKKTFIAALALLAFVSCENKNEKNETTEAPTNVATEATVASGDYAFVDVAYVINESEIVKTEGKQLEEKGKKLEEKFANSERSIQYEMQQLGEKYQKGLITTRDAQTKEEDLQKRMMYLQNQAQKELPAFQEEMMVFNNRVNDYIMRAVQAINAEKKYKMVVNATALLDFDKSLEITSLVLSKVNELYQAELEEAKKENSKK